MEPDPRDFELQNVIGQGSSNCTVVSLACHKPSGQHVAVKRIHLENCDMDFATIQHEASQHKLLSHDHILTSHCSFVHNNEIWIVTPLMAYGSCRDLLQAHFTEGLPELVIAIVLKDVLIGLEYMHYNGIIHRSVRASHILVSESGNVMLSGLRASYSMMETGRRARSVYDFPDNYVQSLLWASPELLEQNLAGYGTKSDIYSLGITACELSNGIVPFSDMKVTQMLLEKIQGIQPKLLDVSTVGEPQSEVEASSAPFNRSFSSHFHDFVDLCLQCDPVLRPSATALLQHSFFKQIKRKSQLGSLPDLLQPIQPLTNVLPPGDETDMDDITQSLAETSIDKHTWDF